MKRKSNKKGFTIVELVIVIAVIAILSAVMIPTFVGIVRKANLSSDESAVAHMNKMISAETVEDLDKIDTLEKLIDTLVEQGIAADENLKPLSKGHKYYWFYQEGKYNRIVLVNDKDEVVYPKDETLAADFATAPDTDKVDLAGGVIYIELETDDRKAVEEALSIGRETITLSDDVKLKNEITIEEGANVTLDLGGNTLSTSQASGRSKYLNVSEGATLTIKNGTFAGRGVQAFDGAKIIIEDATVEVNCVDDNGGAAFWVYEGGTLEINGGTFKATGGDYINDKEEDLDKLAAEPGVINNSGTVIINGGTFSADKSGCYAINNFGDMTINGGTFYGLRGVLATVGGSVTINGGTFEAASDTKAWTVYTSGGTIAINAGEFKGNPAQILCVETSGKITVKGNNTIIAGKKLSDADFAAHIVACTSSNNTVTAITGGYEITK